MKNDKTREVGMFKLIWKNLWARRRKNGWLLAELILVSIISWVVLDPVIVVTHDRNIPLGYDAERLCLISLGALQPQAPGYDAEAQDSATLVDNYYNLVRYVKDFDGVESATPVLGFCYPNSSGSSNSQLFAEGDTIPLSIMMIQFLPHTNFFDTYGFRSGKGRTPGQLSDYAYAPNDIVLTENAAEQLFHTKDAHGKRCISRDHGDTLYMPVVGTIGAMKMYSEWRPVPVAFMPMLTIDTSYIPESAHILVRLKEGVSMERFLHDFRPWMVKEMRRGNLFARSVRSYEQIITESEASNSTPIYRRHLAEEVLKKVGLSHRMRHMPTQLSGGQCQRVAIARAIIGNPEIILADEPTGNLDSKMGAEVMELLHQLNKEDGRTIVMVTHNEEQAKQTSRTVRFFDGRQVE